MSKFVAIVVDDVNPASGDASEGLFPFLLRSYPSGEVIIADSFERMKQEVDQDVEDFMNDYSERHGCEVRREDNGYDPAVKFLIRVLDEDDYIVCTWVIEQIE